MGKMNKMKKVLLTLLVQIIALSVYGQVDVYIEAYGNYSFIPAFEQTVKTDNYLPWATGYPAAYSQYKIVEHYDSKPGLEILIGARKIFLTKLSLETGVGLSVINFKRNTEVKSSESTS